MRTIMGKENRGAEGAGEVHVGRKRRRTAAEEASFGEKFGEPGGTNCRGRRGEWMRVAWGLNRTGDGKGSRLNGRKSGR